MTMETTVFNFPIGGIGLLATILVIGIAVYIFLKNQSKK